MKAKGSSKGKGSLQKTASSIINIHTHRNSNISDTMPFYYNDSIVSIRTNSLHKPSQNYHSFCSQAKKIAREKEDLAAPKQNSKEGREKMKQKNRKKSHHSKSRPLYQLYSEATSTCKPAVSQQLSKIVPPPSQVHLPLQSQPGSEINCKKDADLIFLLKRTRTILDSYRLYSEQLEQDCKHYKSKYGEALRKLKKYQHK